MIPIMMVSFVVLALCPWVISILITLSVRSLSMRSIPGLDMSSFSLSISLSPLSFILSFFVSPLFNIHIEGISFTIYPSSSSSTKPVATIKELGVLYLKSKIDILHNKLHWVLPMLSYCRLIILPLLSIISIKVSGVNLSFPSASTSGKSIVITKITHLSLTLKFKCNKNWTAFAMNIDICKFREGKVRMYSRVERINIASGSLFHSSLQCDFVWPKKGDILLIKSIKPSAVQVKIGKILFTVNLSRDSLPFWLYLLTPNETSIPSKSKVIPSKKEPIKIHFEVDHVIEAVTKLILILVPSHILVKFDAIEGRIQRDDEEEMVIRLNSLSLSSDTSKTDSNPFEWIETKIDLGEVKMFISESNIREGRRSSDLKREEGRKSSDVKRELTKENVFIFLSKFSIKLQYELNFESFSSPSLYLDIKSLHLSFFPFLNSWLPWSFSFYWIDFLKELKKKVPIVIEEKEEIIYVPSFSDNKDLLNCCVFASITDVQIKTYDRVNNRCILGLSIESIGCIEDGSFNYFTTSEIPLEVKKLEFSVPSSSGTLSCCFGVQNIKAFFNLDFHQENPFTLKCECFDLFILYSHSFFICIGESVSSFFFPNIMDLSHSHSFHGGSKIHCIPTLSDTPTAPTFPDFLDFFSEKIQFVPLTNIRIILHRGVLQFPYTLSKNKCYVNEAFVPKTSKYAFLKKLIVEVNSQSKKWAIKIYNLEFYSHTKREEKIKKNEMAKKMEENYAVPSDAVSFISVSKLGFTESLNFEKGFVDMLADGIKGSWTPLIQIQLFRIIMDVTYSVWHFLLYVHEAYYVNQDVRNPAFNDKEHLERIFNYLNFGLSPEGDSIVRLVANNVDIDAIFTRKDGSKKSKEIVLNVSVSQFVSDLLPEIFVFKNVSLSLQKQKILQVEIMKLVHCCDNDEESIYGWLMMEARFRIRAVSMKAGESLSSYTPSILALGSALVAITNSPHYMFPEILNQLQGKTFKSFNDALNFASHLPIPSYFYNPCISESEMLGDEGWKITVNNVQVTLPLDQTSIFEDLSIISEEAENAISVVVGFAKSGPDGYFKPHSLPNFYKYFLIQPLPLWPTPSLSVWLNVKGVNVFIREGERNEYLETIRPLWAEEYNQRNIRQRFFDKKCKTLNITSKSNTGKFMQEQLSIKNSSVYIARAKALRSKMLDQISKGEQVALMNVYIHNISAALKIVQVPILSSMALTNMYNREGISEEDLKNGPAYTSIQHVIIEDLSLTGTRVSLRAYSFPLVELSKFAVCGETNVSLFNNIKATIKGKERVAFGMFKVFSEKTLSLPRLYMDITLSVSSFTFSFCPSYQVAFDDLEKLIKKIVKVNPSSTSTISPSLPITTWDSLRHLLNGQLHLKVKKSEIKLYATSDPYERDAEWLQIDVQSLCFDMNIHGIQIEIIKVQGKQMPSPRGVLCILDLPSVFLQVELKWIPLIPVEEEENMGEKKKNRKINVEESFKSISLVVIVSLELCTRCSSQSDRDLKTESTATNRKPLPLSIVLYGTTIPWLIKWGITYDSYKPKLHFMNKEDDNLNISSVTLSSLQENISSISLSSSGSSGGDQIPESIIKILKEVYVDVLKIGGIDVMVYENATSTLGVRLSVESIDASVRLKAEDEMNPPVVRGKILIPIPKSNPWSLCETFGNIKHIRAQVCTSDSGSRGSFLLSINQVQYAQDRGPFGLTPFDLLSTGMKDNAASDVDLSVTKKKETHTHQSLLDVFGIKSNEDDDNEENNTNKEKRRRKSKDKLKKDDSNRLNFKRQLSSIRDEDETDDDADKQDIYFIHNVAVQHIKVSLTLEVRDALISIAEAFSDLIMDSIPSSNKPPSHLLHQNDIEETPIISRPVSRSSSRAASPSIIGPLPPKRYTTSTPPPGLSSFSLNSLAMEEKRDIPLRIRSSTALSIIGESESSSPKRAARKITMVPMSPAREVRNRFNSNASASPIPSPDKIPSSPSLAQTYLQPLFIIDVLQPQIFARCTESRSAILFSLTSARIEGLQNNDDMESMDKQMMEVDISVVDARLFVAPTDVDIEKGEMWLPLLLPSDIEGFASLQPLNKKRSQKKRKSEKKTNANQKMFSNMFGLYQPIMEPFSLSTNITVRPQAKNSTNVMINIPSIFLSISNDQARMFVCVLTSLSTPYISAALSEKEREEKEKTIKSVLINATSSTRIYEEWKKHESLSWQLGALDVEIKLLKKNLGKEKIRKRDKDVENGLVNENSPTRIIKALVPSIPLKTDEYPEEKEIQEISLQCQPLHMSLEMVRLRLRELVRRELKKDPRIFPDVELIFSSGEISINLVHNSTPFLLASLTLLDATMMGYSDKSGSLLANIGSVSVSHFQDTNGVTASTKLFSSMYEDSLDSRKEEEKDIEEEKETTKRPFLILFNATIGEPVGGIMVIKHFETAVQPLRIRITQQAINQLTTFINQIFVKEEPLEEANARLLFLSSHPNTNSRSSMGVSSLLIPSSPRKSINLERKESLSTPTYIFSAASTNSASKESLIKEKEKNKASMPKVLNEIEERTALNISFNYIRIGEIMVFLSYTGGNRVLHGIEDFNIMELKLHKRVYHGITTSMESFLRTLVGDILLDVFSQAGRNFTNFGTFLGQSLGISRLSNLNNNAEHMDSGGAVVGGARETRGISVSTDLRDIDSGSITPVVMKEGVEGDKGFFVKGKQFGKAISGLAKKIGVSKSNILTPPPTTKSPPPEMKSNIHMLLGSSTNQVGKEIVNNNDEHTHEIITYEVVEESDTVAVHQSPLDVELFMMLQKEHEEEEDGDERR